MVLSCLRSSPPTLWVKTAPWTPRFLHPSQGPSAARLQAVRHAMGKVLAWHLQCYLPGPWHSPGGSGNLPPGSPSPCHPLLPAEVPSAGTDPPSAPLQHCDMRAGRPFSLELPVCYSKRGIWLERGGRSGGWRQDGLPRRCGPMAPLAPALRPAPRGSRRGADTATFPARR